MQPLTKRDQAILIVFYSLFTSLFSYGQVILNTTSTLTAGTGFTCGANFFDNGGSGGNYLTNTDFTVTLCAPAGQYLSVTFSAVSISSASGGGSLPDFFTVNTGSGFTAIPNTGGAGPSSVTYQSTIGGCISFRLDSNGGGVSSGFSGTITCVTPPANDNPCGAVTIPVNSTGCVNTLGTSVNSTLTTGVIEPGCGSFSNNDVWYQAIVPANGTLSVSVVDDNTTTTPFAASLAVYSGTCGALTHQGCNSSVSYSTPSSLNYTGTPGETIFIRVWDYQDNEGTFNICATTTAATMGSVLTGNNTLTCGGTFTDPGGNGNYLTNQYAVYNVCPSTAGQYSTVNFSAFNLGSGDYLTIINGSSTSAPIIGTYTGATLPGTITSSDPSGCLTFAFLSNSSIVSSGWSATVSCSSTPGSNNTSTYCSTSNCSGGCGEIVCGDGSYPTQNNVSSGVQEINAPQVSGCFGTSGEVSSTWYYFQSQSTGTLEIALSGPAGQDYDFAIYGPATNNEVPCPLNTGNGPIRCSFSGAVGSVGLGNGATDYFEGAEGDGWLAPISMQAGEVYAMVLNIYQNGGPQPVIGVDISGSGTLDCSPTITLPVTLYSFEGINEGSHNTINWITNSEINNDYFTIERSLNGLDWEVVGIVQGAGTTAEAHFYSLRDANPYLPVSYYRLTQTDYDGQLTKSHIISVSANNTDALVSGIFPNPSNGYASFTYNGLNEGPLTVTLVNELGNVVKQYVFTDLQKGMLKSIATNDLSDGLYHVVYSQGDWIHNEKLTIIK